MRIVIAGAHGQIGLRLVRLLAARGDEVIGLIRNPGHAQDISAAGGAPVVCDLEIASAEEADVKFIISDHPVTIYNHAVPPETPMCAYPSDPGIARGLTARGRHARSSSPLTPPDGRSGHSSTRTI